MTDATDLLQNAQRFLRAGQRREAEHACRNALLIDPENSVANGLLGQMLLAKGDAASAARFLRVVVEQGVASPTLLAQYAQCLAAHRDQNGALEAARQAVERDPQGWATCLHAAIALAMLNHPEQETAFSRALDLTPDQAACLVQAADVLRAHLHYRLAAKALRRLVALAPQDPASHHALAGALYYLRDFAGSEAALRNALALRPDFAPAWSSLCRVLQRMNRLEDAREAGRRAVELAPDAGEAHLELARVERRLHRPNDARRRLLLIAESPTIPPDALVTVHNELGHVLDTLDECDAAYQHFVRSGEIWLNLPQTRRYSLDRFPKRLAAWASVDWKRTVRNRPGNDTPSPIFLVGFPRSGTTLLEQMLSCHPDVVATDEEPLLTRELLAPIRRAIPSGASLPGHLGNISDEVVAAAAAAYWAGAQRLFGKRLAGKRLLDKSPLNICFLPLIRRIFPQSPVIVALRDPRDCCLSGLMAEFRANDAMVHFGRLDTIVALYARVMSLWIGYRADLGLRYIESKYEDLTADTPAQLQRIADFCALPWHETMLEPAKKSRAVRTPSYQGIARSVYRNAVERWHRYRAHLEPHFPLLDPFVRAFEYPADPPNTAMA
ncbi:MAG: sulfotransferase [Phycisphaeraceae bacterium]|nr:sulfotransferase [Phycisphaeraceae bacterium]